MIGASSSPLIVAGALKLRQKHFAIDGEVVVLGKFSAPPLQIRHEQPLAAGMAKTTRRTSINKKNKTLSSGCGANRLRVVCCGRR
jgi:hypothetical protein